MKTEIEAILVSFLILITLFMFYGLMHSANVYPTSMANRVRVQSERALNIHKANNKGASNTTANYK